MNFTNTNTNFNGKIKLIIGPMFSGKTSELINRYRKYSIANKKCLLIKYKKDNRYSSDKIVTHDGTNIEAVTCLLLKEIDYYIDNYDVVCIDEIQFYDDASTYCEKWANKGKIVEACGLNGDYERKPFKVITNLIPLVDDIIYLKAVCIETGKDASFSFRLVNNKNKELIGGSKEYSAVDRKTYLINSNK